MILGQSPTANNPVPFQRPAAANPGYVPHMPRTRFMSPNIWPFSQVLNPMRAYPAYRPQLPAGVGPHGFPPESPAPAAVPSANVATTAPVPAIATNPSGTNGFGGSGFGSHGGVHKHFHVDPYMVMRSGWIPGVSPSGSNIRSGYKNALARVNRSMPYQSAPLPPPPPPPPPMPMPAATHGFGHHRHHHHHMQGADELGFPGFRREFRRPGGYNPGFQPGMYQQPQPGFQPQQPGMPFHHRHHHHMGDQQQPAQPPPQAYAPQFGAPGADGCEWVGPRIDGISVKICDGKVISYRDAQGNMMTPGDFQGPREGWFMRNFGWRRHHHRMA
jgi:hypothetical protein